MQIFAPYFKATTIRRRNVCLYKECRHHTDRKKRDQGIGVLVASAFIPNPSKLPCVNHIDGNKENNISTIQIFVYPV